MRYQQKGFTFIELILVVILLGIISVVIGRILLEGYRTFLTSQSILETDWQGWMALERMVNDIHTIRSAADLSTIQPNQLIFVNMNGNTIQYQLSGSSLMRNSFVLASGIQSLNFSYLDANGATTATPSAVRYISLSLSVAHDPLTQTVSTLAATRGMS